MPKYIFVLVVICTLMSACNPEKEVTSLEIEKSSLSQDSILLDRVQRESFNYMWEGEEPTSGAARERIHLDGIYMHDDQDVVTSGGTGFGIMAILVGIERGFITRREGYTRLKKLADWLGKTERFHGAWSHWIFPDGKAKAFSKYDDGGDLVETSYLIQGMITARQYFQNGSEEEQALASQLDSLWKGVDWNWYTNNENVLYWHWSSKYEWKMNFKVRGYNECLIMYILAASSPTHPIEPKVYHEGFMRGGDIVSDRVFYDLPTILDHYDSNDMAVGPLFWAHYSYLGLDPRGLKDKYADFWTLNQNQALIHYRHCIANPNEYEGYSDRCWGLTSSYSMKGYAGHNPEEDRGVISPTAALSSFPYTPEESMKFLKYMYEEQDSLVGKYGPYDAFSFENNWYLPRYLAIDQLPISVMIENYRSGLLWELFMSAPEISKGLDRLGFERTASN